jgi:hypothetical protein
VYLNVCKKLVFHLSCHFETGKVYNHNGIIYI